jgi:uncharacterized membrane protein YheB (UPF0754 family)
MASKINNIKNDIKSEIRSVIGKSASKSENKKDDNITVLNEIYQISEMGKQAISNIIPKVDDENFKKQLINSYENYEEICSKSTTEIMKMGEKPREKNPLSKAMLWGSVNVSTLLDNSPSNIAEMIIKGCHNGMNDLTRTMNQHKENLDENVKMIADSYMKKEQSNIDSIQKFL